MVLLQSDSGITLFIFIIAAIGLMILIAMVLFRNMMVPKRMESIRRLIENGDIKLAIRALKQVLSKNERNAEAHFLLGEAYFSEKRYELAIVEYKYVMRLANYSKTLSESSVRRRLAVIYEYYNQDKEALAELLLIVQQEPDSFEVLNKIAQIFLKRKKYEQAINYLKRTLHVNPNHAESYYALGYIYYIGNKVQESQGYLQRAISLDKRMFKAHLYLGMIYKMTGQLEMAGREFEQAQRDATIRQRAVLENGKVYLERGNVQTATIEFERAVKFSKTEDDITLEARYWFGYCLEQARDLPGAIEQWEKIVAINSNYKDVMEKLQSYNELRTDDRMKDFLIASKDHFIEIAHELITKGLKLDVVESYPISDSHINILATESESKWRNTRKVNRWVSIRRTNDPITESMVRKQNDEMKEYNANRSIIITSSLFSSGAQEYALTRPIDLVDKKQLQQLLKEVGTLHR